MHETTFAADMQTTYGTIQYGTVNGQFYDKVAAVSIRHSSSWTDMTQLGYSANTAYYQYFSQAIKQQTPSLQP